MCVRVCEFLVREEGEEGGGRGIEWRVKEKKKKREKKRRGEKNAKI